MAQITPDESAGIRAMKIRSLKYVQDHNRFGCFESGYDTVLVQFDTLGKIICEERKRGNGFNYNYDYIYNKYGYVIFSCSTGLADRKWTYKYDTSVSPLRILYKLEEDSFNSIYNKYNYNDDGKIITTTETDNNSISVRIHFYNRKGQKKKMIIYSTSAQRTDRYRYRFYSIRRGSLVKTKCTKSIRHFKDIFSYISLSSSYFDDKRRLIKTKTAKYVTEKQYDDYNNVTKETNYRKGFFIKYDYKVWNRAYEYTFYE